MAKYLTAKNRNSLLEHVAAFRDIRRWVDQHEEQLIRIAYKPSITPRDEGKISSSLNFLAHLCNEAERKACHATLNRLKLKID